MCSGPERPSSAHFGRNHATDGHAGHAGALFFADFDRECIWAMLPGANGLPNPANRELIRANVSSPTDLKLGPGGDIFYVDFNGGTIRRITFG